MPRKLAPGKRRPKRPAASKGRPSKASKPSRRAARKVEPAFPLPDGWTLDADGKSISRQVRTRDFLEAVGLINDLAPVAEDLNHHPDLHLERWNRLRITTYSHDVGKLTERDERLSQRVNDVLAKRGFTA